MRSSQEGKAPICFQHVTDVEDTVGVERIPLQPNSVDLGIVRKRLSKKISTKSSFSFQNSYFTDWKDAVFVDVVSRDVPGRQSRLSHDWVRNRNHTEKRANLFRVDEFRNGRGAGILYYIVA